MADIRANLAERGYTVLRAGQHRADLSGSDPGVPDLLVSRPGWGCWIGLEVKTASGKPSDEQGRLVRLGMTCLVRSVAEAVEAVER